MKDWTGNKNSIYKTLGASNHTDKEREVNDYYATDPIAIDKLTQVETVSRYVWEPAAGGGHLAQRLKERGHTVMTSDIVERGYKLDCCVDFLDNKPLNIKLDTFLKSTKPFADIVTNPPYKYAKEFVLQALSRVNIGAKVFMFLKLTFLEGKTRYKELFSKYPPKKIWVFSERVMCAKNGDFDGMRAGGGSAVAYAWFVWEKGYTGKTTIGWL